MVHHVPSLLAFWPVVPEAFGVLSLGFGSVMLKHVQCSSLVVLGM